jgi:hypothetical protein
VIVLVAVLVEGVVAMRVRERGRVCGRRWRVGEEREGQQPTGDAHVAMVDCPRGVSFRVKFSLLGAYLSMPFKLVGGGWWVVGGRERAVPVGVGGVGGGSRDVGSWGTGCELPEA